MVISERTAHKAMREITDYYDNYPGHHIDKQFLLNKKVCSPQKIDALIRYLCSNGAITYGPTDDYEWDCITLINRHYCEDQKKEQRTVAKDTRRFWIGFIKDLLIFLLGLIVEGHLGIVRTAIEYITKLV